MKNDGMQALKALKLDENFSFNHSIRLEDVLNHFGMDDLSEFKPASSNASDIKAATDLITKRYVKASGTVTKLTTKFDDAKSNIEKNVGKPAKQASDFYKAQDKLNQSIRDLNFENALLFYVLRYISQSVHESVPKNSDKLSDISDKI